MLVEGPVDESLFFDDSSFVADEILVDGPEILAEDVTIVSFA
jgi:hypothetical protein